MTRPPRRTLAVRPRPTLARAAGFAALLGLAVGCARPAPPLAKTAPSLVTVATPEVRYEVIDFEDFTGRTEAVESVELRARVTGYLTKINFDDGAIVKKGDVLFELDPESYRRELERAQALEVQAKAHLERVEKDYKRAEGLRGGGSITHEEWDRIVGDLAEARAAAQVAEKAVKLAEVNLDYTRIKAPFAGRLSRRFMHHGALIKADDTILTWLGTVDPVYVNFDIDDRTALHIRRLILEGRVPADWQLLLEGKVPANGSGKVQVQVGLPDEDDFSLVGVVNFVNSFIDPGTGTLRVRAEVHNEGFRLPPNLFVRVRLPVGLPRRAVLVPDEAVGTDQDKKFVYVVNKEPRPDGSVGYRAEYRQVKLGPQVGSKRVIEAGVSEGEQVIVSGLQRVRDHAEVNPKPAKPAPAAPAAPSPGQSPSQPPSFPVVGQPPAGSAPAPATPNPTRPAGG